MTLWSPPSSTIDFAWSSKLLGTAGVAGTFSKENRPTSEYRHVAGSVDLGLTELTPLSPGAFQRLAR